MEAVGRLVLDDVRAGAVESLGVLPVPVFKAPDGSAPSADCRRTGASAVVVVVVVVVAVAGFCSASADWEWVKGGRVVAALAGVAEVAGCAVVAAGVGVDGVCVVAVVGVGVDGVAGRAVVVAADVLGGCRSLAVRRSADGCAALLEDAAWGREALRVSGGACGSRGSVGGVLDVVVVAAAAVVAFVAVVGAVGVAGVDALEGEAGDEGLDGDPPAGVFGRFAFSVAAEVSSDRRLGGVSPPGSRRRVGGNDWLRGATLSAPARCGRAPSRAS